MNKEKLKQFAQDCLEQEKKDQTGMTQFEAEINRLLLESTSFEEFNILEEVMDSVGYVGSESLNLFICKAQLKAQIPTLAEIA